MKTKIRSVGHKEDNGPGDANYYTTEIQPIKLEDGTEVSVAGGERNMYGHDIGVCGVSIMGGASVAITKQPSSPSPCPNPVPHGEVMCLNERGKYHSTSEGPWDGEAEVEIEPYMLAMLPGVRKAVELMKERGITGGCLSARYPRRGKEPYIIWEFFGDSSRDAERYQQFVEAIKEIIAEAMKVVKFPGNPPRAPEHYKEIGEIPGEVADVIDQSSGRELRRAIQKGLGGEVINKWLDSLTDPEFDRVAALVS